MRLIVNGASHDVAVPGHETLLVTLRERLQLTGTKLVCGRGECGACTVLLNGRSAYSCLTLTAACSNQAITTIEGIGREDSPHPLQAAFIEHDALQCGFCTPGMVTTLIEFLRDCPKPTERDVRVAISGNLCRCTGYQGIIDAVLRVTSTKDE